MLEESAFGCVRKVFILAVREGLADIYLVGLLEIGPQEAYASRAQAIEKQRMKWKLVCLCGHIDIGGCHAAKMYAERQKISER